MVLQNCIHFSILISKAKCTFVRPFWGVSQDISHLATLSTIPTTFDDGNFIFIFLAKQFASKIHFHKAKKKHRKFQSILYILNNRIFRCFYVHSKQFYIRISFFQFCKCVSKGVVSNVNLVIELSFSLFKKGMGIWWCLFWQK